MVFATLKNDKWLEKQSNLRNNIQEGVKSGSSQEQEGVKSEPSPDQKSDKIDFDQKDSIVEFCILPRTRREIQEYVGMSSRAHFKENYLTPLIKEGRIRMTIPDKPNSRNQKYVKA